MKLKSSLSSRALLVGLSGGCRLADATLPMDFDLLCEQKFQEAKNKSTKCKIANIVPMPQCIPLGGLS